MEKLRYDSFHFILKSFIICFRVTQDGLYHLLSTPGLSARKGETVRIIHTLKLIYWGNNLYHIQSFISFKTHSHLSGIIGMRLKLENEEIKEITANWHCFSEMTPKWPEWGWNERNVRDFKTQVKFGGAKIEASYWSRVQNQGLWLVESRWFQKFKP